MLVKEMRDILKKYDKEQIIDIAVELYKKVPKDKKEDYDIDNYIINNSNKIKKKEDILSFDELINDINRFLTCVDNDLYVYPNKIINKSERSKWRFKVKKYYKILTSLTPDTDDGMIATKFLCEIFKRLSTGSVYLKFSSWNTFGAIGVSQSEYYGMLVRRILYNGADLDNIKKCVNLLIVEKSSDELSSSMFYTLLNSLNYNNINLDTINIIEELINNLKERKNKVKSNMLIYKIETDINDCVELICNMYFRMNDFDKGIKYFKKNYIHYNKEVKEYILLELIEEYEEIEIWIKEYESNKLDYRDSLKEKYNKYKNILNNK